MNFSLNTRLIIVMLISVIGINSFAQTCPTSPTYNSNTNVTIGTGEVCNVGGSVTTPSNRSPNINITGDGRMDIDGSLTLQGNSSNINMNTTDSLIIRGDLVLEGNGDITLTNGTLFVTGNLTINGNAAFGAGGNVVIGGNFTVTGNNADVTVGGGFNVSGNTDLGSETLTVESGAVFQSTSYTSTGGNITVDSGGTINVDGGIPDGESVNNLDTTDTDCTNGCCGSLCNTTGDDLGEGATEILPIDLLYFEGSSEINRVMLEWASLIEKNNDYYTVERSLDGLTYEEVCTVEGAGNSDEVLRYSCEDYSPYFGNILYRLTQTDYDGQSETFKDILVEHLSSDQPISLVPSMAQRSQPVTLRGGWGLAEYVDLKIYDLQGVAVHEVRYRTVADRVEITTDHLSKGYYVLKGAVNQIPVQERFIVRD
ncbi:MAG: hypothetical protein R8G66_07025 [Cytophagales bacterium]|nr:hypothetical protein [Cytophagales bacterium]